MLDYIIWNVTPEIIDGFRIRWYGLFFAIGFFVSYTILNKIFLREGISQKETDNFTFLVFLLLIVGLRLGHCLFYEPEYYLNNPLQILYIWKGGLASHGGAIGLLAAFIIFSYRTKRSFLWVMSRAAIVIPFTATMVRFGNLMNSEIYGIVTDLPWSFVFVRDAIIASTPEALTSIINESGAVAAEYQHLVARLFAGSTETLQQGIPYIEIQDALLRHELIRKDDVPKLVDSFVSAGLLKTHHPTQIYEALVYLGTFLTLILYYMRQVKKKLPVSHNFILAITFLIIFTARFIIEFIKNNQVEFEQYMTLNMGQWLSIPFILIGVFFLIKYFAEPKKQTV
ncbi:MAG: prolipoprotein diacylglyceryl transferase [Bacteroidales bacterium]